MARTVAQARRSHRTPPPANGLNQDGEEAERKKETAGIEALLRMREGNTETPPPVRTNTENGSSSEEEESSTEEESSGLDPDLNPVNLEGLDEVLCRHGSELQSILAAVARTGRLPCVVYHRNRGTLCEKDLASDRYILEGDNGEDEGRTLAASKLIRLYGPKGGPQSRNDEAIKIRPPYAKLVDLDPSQLHTHGAWYRMFAMEMDRLEREWKAKLPINSKRWRGRGPHSPKRKTTDEDKPSTDDQEKSDKRPRPNNDPRKASMTEKRATNANSSDDNANVDSPKPEEEVVRILNTPVKPFLELSEKTVSELTESAQVAYIQACQKAFRDAQIARCISEWIGGWS